MVSNQFNTCSETYAEIRPIYSAELFKWLNTITASHELALDCGTGNGQAAYQLASYFSQVIAIDKCPKQILHARKHKKIQYKNVYSEYINLPDNSVDLITCACSAHWFDLNSFYPEANRVLKPNGKIAIWTYTWPHALDAAVDRALTAIKNSLANHWSAGSLLHLNQYRDLPFPFIAISTPELSFDISWTLDEVIKFFMTWACIIEYTEKHNKQFIENIRDHLRACWPTNVKRIRFLFPLHLKAGSTH
jgi:ubiquinone/menaquinone biosynthesis C-methylase UbiE